MRHLTVLICTHNRAALLERTLGTLNAAQRPADWEVTLLVAANACQDGTHDYLSRYQQAQSDNHTLMLDWFAEPTPGKSHALNAALRRLPASTDLIAFVDDDHRVDDHYLAALCEAATQYPHNQLFCGRILPDWDGSEPGWVHDTGRYRIYPLPVPRFDQGDDSREFTQGGPVPGGGNLAITPALFARIGEFSTELGPQGHDLGGGEDIEFVTRALNSGEHIRYVPAMIQHHYVDHDRLQLGYMLKKSFQRSRSAIRVKTGNDTRIPRYAWRKIAEYLWQGVFSLHATKRRFFLIRLAAALGELRGYRDTAADLSPKRVDHTA